MNPVVFGATGGTGRAVVQSLLEQGHRATAFVRNGSAVAPAPGLTICTGDATNVKDVARAMPGHDAVVVSLGNSQNAFALMLGARRTTPANICERGTANIIAAMRANAIKRLVVVSAFGVGDTKTKADIMTRLFFRLVLREHMADKENQEALVKSSALDWTLVQPVALVDTPRGGNWSASEDGTVRKPMIARSDLAAFIVVELAAAKHIGQSVTLSG
jgi:uncharacterized protein YbjT (DUF2867 family)